MKKKNAIKRQKKSKQENPPEIVTVEHITAVYSVLKEQNAVILSLREDIEALKHNMMLLNSLVIK